uniref:Putative hydrolase of the HAD superfamily n=1 Tax=Candidatus Kentrum sp. LPFa TaxID=2126335 RepID=A0A450W1W0_9GAMM|nr:MAG: putative hydrolase of the HAD superfamily [Candidatus Kentron sp. LPFa]
MTLPRIIFFDAGNTLFHFHPFIDEMYREVSAAFGCHVSPAALEKGSFEAWADYQKQLAQSQSPEAFRASKEQEIRMWRARAHALHARLPELTCDWDAWADAVYEALGEARRFRLFPDVMETLQEIRAMGIRVGVISNWDPRLESILTGLGFGDIPDVVVVSSLAGWRKPDSRIFEIALDRAGVRPRDAVYVGDLIQDDVVGATSVGSDPCSSINARAEPSMKNTYCPNGKFPLIPLLAYFRHFPSF